MVESSRTVNAILNLSIKRLKSLSLSPGSIGDSLSYWSASEHLKHDKAGERGELQRVRRFLPH